MQRLPPSQFFPPVEQAHPSGVVAVGGKLNTSWLLDAYRHGIFPWPFSDGPLAWWSPDPRAVIEFGNLYVSRRLARTCRSGRFELTCDRAFDAVIHGCATANDRRGGTWLTPAMQAAYRKLHRDGHAHSIEVWKEGELAGGTYGVAIGASFSAESAFYRVRDASKVAVVCLVAHLRARGFELLDIQQLTPHSKSLGATEIPRHRFLARLAAAAGKAVTFGSSLEGSDDRQSGTA